jgi:hypothetical protein
MYYINMGNCHIKNVEVKFVNQRPSIHYRFQPDKRPCLSIYNSYHLKEFYTVNNVTKVSTIWKYNAFNGAEFISYIDSILYSIMKTLYDQKLVVNKDVYVSTNIGFADQKCNVDDVAEITKIFVKYLKCIEVVKKI